MGLIVMGAAEPAPMLRAAADDTRSASGRADVTDTWLAATSAAGAPSTVMEPASATTPASAGSTLDMRMRNVTNCPFVGGESLEDLRAKDQIRLQSFDGGSDTLTTTWVTVHK